MQRHWFIEFAHGVESTLFQRCVSVGSLTFNRRYFNVVCQLGTFSDVAVQLISIAPPPPRRRYYPMMFYNEPSGQLGPQLYGGMSRRIGGASRGVLGRNNYAPIASPERMATADLERVVPVLDLGKITNEESLAPVTKTRKLFPETWLWETTDIESVYMSIA